MLDAGSPYFAFARDKITEEKAVLAKLTNMAAAFRVQPLSEAIVGIMIGLLLTSVLSFSAARLALLNAASVVIKEPLNGWSQPYWAWTGLFTAALIVREVITGALTVEKSWFGGASFCVSTTAWILNWITLAGLAMVVSYPATVFWLLSSGRHRPAKLDFAATDDGCGVSDYVLFLQTWPFSILVFLLIPCVLLIHLTIVSGRFSRIYLLPIAVLAGAALPGQPGPAFERKICGRTRLRTFSANTGGNFPRQ